MIKEIKKLIRNGESERVELKQSLSDVKRITEIVCSFANSNGGTLIIGVNNKGKIVGLDIGKQTIEQLTNTITDNIEPVIYPAIKVAKMESKNIIVIKIEKSSNKPHTAYGKAFIRVGKNTKLMKQSKYEELLLEKSRHKLQFDKEICAQANYKDIDMNKVKSFLEKRSKFSHVAIPSDVKKTLEAIRGIKKIKDKLRVTNLGLLFFGKNPQKFIAHSEVKVARFKGTDMVEFIDEARIKTTFLEALDEVEKFVKKNTRKAMKIVEFERVDIPEYPYEAIREALVNALAHRDYFFTGATIRVLIFDDRIEIDNPGIPPFPIKEIEGKHFARNELICRRFHDVGEMEEYGTGITKMKRLMKEHGLKEPVFDKSANFFKVIFYGPKEKILDLVPSVPKERRTNLKELGLNERQIEALKIMVNEGKEITNKDYRKMFNTTIKTASRDLRSLVDKKLVIKRGFRKNARYESV